MYVNLRVFGHLKDELAWAIDNWLWVTSNKMFFKTVIYTTKKKKVVINMKLYCMDCCVTFNNVF